jgi:hypothetical protein
MTNELLNNFVIHVIHEINSEIQLFKYHFKIAI